VGDTKRHAHRERERDGWFGWAGVGGRDSTVRSQAYVGVVLGACDERLEGRLALQQSLPVRQPMPQLATERKRQCETQRERERERERERDRR
jgi:hypothetical protein